MLEIQKNKIKIPSGHKIEILRICELREDTSSKTVSPERNFKTYVDKTLEMSNFDFYPISFKF